MWKLGTKYGMNAGQTWQESHMPGADSKHVSERQYNTVSIAWGIRLKPHHLLDVWQ